jgi:hypothetical protein
VTGEPEVVNGPGNTVLIQARSRIRFRSATATNCESYEYKPYLVDRLIADPDHQKSQQPKDAEVKRTLKMLDRQGEGIEEIDKLGSH